MGIQSLSRSCKKKKKSVNTKGAEVEKVLFSSQPEVKKKKNQNRRPEGQMW